MPTMRALTPPERRAAAQTLLENEEFQALASERLHTLKQDTMDLTEDKEILKAHQDHAALRDFVEWLKEVSET